MNIIFILNVKLQDLFEILNIYNSPNMVFLLLISYTQKIFLRKLYNMVTDTQSLCNGIPVSTGLDILQ